MQTLKRCPVGWLRDAKPASRPLPIDGNTSWANSTFKYSAYHSTPDQGTWPSLNYTRCRKSAKAQALLHRIATRRETRAAAPAHRWQCFLGQSTLKYSAYDSTPDRDAWPSLNYTRVENLLIGELRGAKPASQPLVIPNTLAARAAQKFSAYYRGAWRSLNYT